MKRLVVYIIMCIATVFYVSAQTQFRTAELERLAKVMGIDKQAMPDGYCSVMAKNQWLTIHSSNKTVDHIGLRLFADDIRTLDPSPVFDFLERYFLQLQFPQGEKTAALMARDDEFRFECGSLQTLSELKLTDTFVYHCDNHRYIATWSREDHELLCVSFPVEYQLMSGENKIEAENHILDDIRQTAIVHTPDAVDAQSNDYYIVESCTNRLYSVGDKLVASSRYPAETAANMLLSTEMNGKVLLNMTQLAYGFRKTSAEVDLKQWITFCRNSRCQLFVGIDRVDDNGNVEAVVLAVNKTENYNHVLTVTIPAEVIGMQQGIIEARLYSYVPTQNIRNLFGDYRKSNPKTFVTK